MLSMFLVSSDPYISSLRKLPKTNLKVFSLEVTDKNYKTSPMHSDSKSESEEEEEIVRDVTEDEREVDSNEK